MGATFQIPAGPLNLQDAFPGVDFNNVAEYYIELHNTGDDSVIMTSNRYKNACCCGDDVVRLFFVNYLGGIDAINFQIADETTKVKSDQWKKSLPYPLKKFDGGLQRFNVESNETITAECYCFDETDQPWLKEIMASPNAWIQAPETQQQDADYLPVVILDSDFITRQEIGNRYSYVLQIQFIMANENISLRN